MKYKDLDVLEPIKQKEFSKWTEKGSYTLFYENKYSEKPSLIIPTRNVISMTLVDEEEPEVREIKDGKKSIYGYSQERLEY